MTAAGTGENSQPSPAMSLGRWLCLLAFVACLAKVCNLGIWPHAYMADPDRAAAWTASGNVLSPFYSLAWIALTLANAAVNRKVVFGLMSRERLLLVFFIYLTMHSLFFAEAKASSLKLAFYYVAIFIDVATFTTLFGARRTLTILTSLALLHAAVNLASVAWPEYSAMRGGHEGLFRGLAAHKNDLGQQAVFFATASLYATGARSLVRAAAVGGSVMLVLMSFSGQTVTLLALVFGIFSLFVVGSRLPHQARAGLYIIGATVGGVVITILIQNGSFFELLGKTADLTSRNLLWDFFLKDVLANPWGYGLAAFVDNPALYDRMRSFGIWWPLATAHSAYLEAFLQLGWVGGICFSLVVLTALRRVFAASMTRDRTCMFGVTLIVSALVGGVTASEKLFLPDLGWIGFLAGWMIMNHASLQLRNAPSETQSAPLLGRHSRLQPRPYDRVHPGFGPQPDGWRF